MTTVFINLSAIPDSALPRKNEHLKEKKNTHTQN
jgi:hypothetical protein